MTETQSALWPYLPTLEHLGLALALGLFVGLERERRGKEAGLRTFGLASLLGALGAMLGTPFAIFSLATVAMLAVFLNIQTLRAGEGAELTTTAALMVTTFAGLLVGLGHRLTPAALAVVTAALLAWKERLSGFSKALSEAELRSAILLAILAFVVYPALPAGSVDRWHLVEPRAAWMTVLLVAGMGFANYVLLKLYG
ncbi:MAG TPA: MgtC/SapB family protein, partial [Polyangia bacterium]|nr:MgtC/SapB family protein [Polyangia bacterium]